MTPNREDYLKEIYKLGGAERRITNKEISEVLGISPASVTEMQTKMSDEGLINYQPYKGSCLTTKGIAHAIPLVRGHRLWEVFLIRHLGYSWSEAHEDAELLEHIASERLAARLDRFLNYPAYCPHGFEIPSLNGEAQELALRPLTELAPGDTSPIRKVLEDLELLDYLQATGVEMGSQVTLVTAGAYEGPLTLKLDGAEEIQISYKAASQIYVEHPTPS